VALPEGSLVVNSSQGGGSKDTWVLAEATDAFTFDPAALAPPEPVTPRPAPPVPLQFGPADDHERHHQQQLQQQQGADEAVDDGRQQRC
jgi:hypothetical protein